ncbi:MAG: 4Fe-4S binding protein [candidate division Zixibacteria bacterium]|nr:4Fe-4S binding protein [candidate division Zixibacteria bacterium]
MKEKIFQLKTKTFWAAMFWPGLFFAIGIWRYLATDGLFYIFIFGYIGLAIAIGAIVTDGLIDKYKPWGRRVTQLLIGVFMFGFLGLLGHENMQIEGFYFYLFAGVFAGATLHYLIAKLVGPLVFGRAWCGWACWTMMVLDFFPWKVPQNGRIKYFGLIRYIHFALATAGVVVLIFLYDYGPREHYESQFYWLIIGNTAYYLLAIILAAILKDNRAFCKYICPIPVTQKILSRFSISKQQIDNELCDECEICEENCPMDIKLLDYSRNDQRILSTECILCNTCLYNCPSDAIKTTNKFDIGIKEFINFK